MTLTSDTWTILGLFGGLALLGIAFGTGSLATERRRQDPTLSPSAPPRPLAVDRLVEINAGPHRGLVGWVHDLFVDAATGRRLVTVRSQLGEFVTVPREDVSALFG